MSFQLVDADESLVAQAVQVWESGWHETRGRIVPKQLVELRTSASFSSRLRGNIRTARIGLDGDDVAGLCITKNNELYQLYVSPKARGRGLAQLLMTDAENRLRTAGHASAWLACAVGNRRAARFYEKAGWSNVETRIAELDTPQGVFPLPVWHFEKQLGAAGLSGPGASCVQAEPPERRQDAPDSKC